jgi:O-antigen ligase/tetratricopeptide (TPR) repeat protein
MPRRMKHPSAAVIPVRSVSALLVRALLIVGLGLTPLVFSVHLAESFEEPKAALFESIALLIAAVAPWTATDGSAAWSRLRPLLRDPITLGVVLFVTSAALSTCCSLSSLQSWRGDRDYPAGLRTLLACLVIFLAVRLVVRTAADGRRLLTATVPAVALASVYGWLQSCNLDPIDWQGASQIGTLLRASGPNGHANLFGAWLAMTLPPLLVLALLAFRRRRTIRGGVLVVAVCLGVTATVLTLSRGAWLALAVALGVLLLGWWFGGARRAALVLGGVLLFGLALGGAIPPLLRPELADGLKRRLADGTDGAGRSAIWRAAWRMFLDWPLTGCGTDCFRLGFGRHRPADLDTAEGAVTPTRAHNDFLHILATQGLPGAAALLLFGFGLLRGGVRAWRGGAVADRPFLAAVGAALAAWIVQGLVGFTTVGCGVLVLVCAALLSRLADTAGVRLPQPARRASKGVRSALAGASGWSGVILRTGMAALALFLLTTCELRPLLASYCNHKGDELVDADPNTSLAWHDRAIDLDGDRILLRMRRAAVVHQTAQSAPEPAASCSLLRRTRRELEETCRLAPNDPDARASLARLLVEMTAAGLVDPSAPLRAWDETLALEPNHPVLLTEAVRAFLFLGERERARRFLGHALELYPHRAGLRAALGACHFADGQLDAAAQALETALTDNWTDEDEGPARACAMLAAVRLAQHRFDLAEAPARRAVLSRPDWPTAWLLLAQALEGLGRSADAHFHYQQANRLTAAANHP